jgi:hypothetical protein
MLKPSLPFTPLKINLLDRLSAERRPAINICEHQLGLLVKFLGGTRAPAARSFTTIQLVEETAVNANNPGRDLSLAVDPDPKWIRRRSPASRAKRR